MIIFNLFINTPLEKIANRRRDFFSTEWAITVVPGVFYARNLKYNLYTKAFKIKHKVKNAFVVINLFDLIYKRVSIVRAVGEDVDVVVSGPDPQIAKRPRKWTFDLSGIKLKNIHGQIYNKPFSAPNDKVEVDVETFIDITKLNIRHIIWHFNKSKIKSVVSNIQGTAKFSFNGLIPEMLNDATAQAKVGFSVPGIKKKNIQLSPIAISVVSKFKNREFTFNSLTTIDKIKIKKTMMNSSLSAEGKLNFYHKNPKFSTGYLNLEIKNNAYFNKRVYDQEEQVLKLKMHPLSLNTKSKVLKGRVKGKLDDMRQVTNFVYENYNIPKIAARILGKSSGKIQSDIVATMDEIKFQDSVFDLHKNKGFFGDFIYNRKKGLSGKGKIKFYIFKIKVQVKDNELDFF